MNIVLNIVLRTLCLSALLSWSVEASHTPEFAKTSDIPDNGVGVIVLPQTITSNVLTENILAQLPSNIKKEGPEEGSDRFSNESIKKKALTKNPSHKDIKSFLNLESTTSYTALKNPLKENVPCIVFFPRSLSKNFAQNINLYGLTDEEKIPFELRSKLFEKTNLISFIGKLPNRHFLVSLIIEDKESPKTRTYHIPCNPLWLKEFNSIHLYGTKQSENIQNCIEMILKFKQRNFVLPNGRLSETTLENFCGSVPVTISSPGMPNLKRWILPYVQEDKEKMDDIE